MVMNINDIFDLTSTYLSVLRVEHIMLAKLILSTVKGEVNCSRLVRVLGGHIEKEGRVLSKYGIAINSMQALSRLYNEYYEECLEDKVNGRLLTELLKVIKDHDEELALIMDRLINEYFTSIINEIH
ncbi:hypothetical protein Cmaq_0283 [Caldivirga maquilingensis IC-167]|uniref:Uncharacterized protein n=2 Tax=Caldivirga maquilingensis TaxID=76887 RepID=A8MAU5_CALMQ|nr:hypothetical protein Cmaq_0283 [Caldivirga maquilingensis IC-167]